LLGAADHLADDLRQKIESRVSAPVALSDEDPLNADGIAFLYFQAFGVNPPQYEVDFLLKKANELSVATIGKARVGLSRKVLQKLSEIHRARFWTRMAESEAFEYGLLFATKGNFAFEEYRGRVDRDWAEVEAVARREALSRMPDTYREFKKELRCGNVPWEALFELGAVKSCLRCGNDILDADAATEAIAEHYGKEDISDELYPLLADLEGIESADSAGYCSYCGWQMSKDD
jgi:hypothetical protein